MKIEPRWSFGDGRVGYAVGDVHGRADLLKLMIGRIETDIRQTKAADPVIIFLGDYIDRGPCSRDVVDCLMRDIPAGVERRVLRGNHEAAMSYFLEEPWKGRAWLAHGGTHTLLSYGVAPPSAGAGKAAHERTAEVLRAAMGSRHLRFLENLERCAIYGDYLFAHAGVDPRLPLHRQQDADFYWIRERFLKCDAKFSHRVVHGHTPTAAPHVDERRVGVDTGAYFSGRLTAARIERSEVSFIEVTAGAEVAEKSNWSPIDAHGAKEATSF